LFLTTLFLCSGTILSNAQDMMEKNKELARRFYQEVINEGNGTVMQQIMAEDFIDHYASPDLPKGIEGFKAFLKMIATAFPDIKVKTEDIIAEGDKVTVRLTVTGTHMGVLLGKFPPTGKYASWVGIDILKVSNGIIVERWSQRDLLGMMRQLGLIP
jgi:steroid delta-isomerase-like uncharacterized protein